MGRRGSGIMTGATPPRRGPSVYISGCLRHPLVLARAARSARSGGVGVSDAFHQWVPPAPTLRLVRRRARAFRWASASPTPPHSVAHGDAVGGADRRRRRGPRRRCGSRGRDRRDPAPASRRRTDRNGAESSDGARPRPAASSGSNVQRGAATASGGGFAGDEHARQELQVDLHLRPPPIVPKTIAGAPHREAPSRARACALGARRRDTSRACDTRRGRGGGRPCRGRRRRSRTRGRGSD